MNCNCGDFRSLLHVKTSNSHCTSTGMSTTLMKNCNSGVSTVICTSRPETSLAGVVVVWWWCGGMVVVWWWCGGGGGVVVCVVCVVQMIHRTACHSRHVRMMQLIREAERLGASSRRPRHPFPALMAEEPWPCTCVDSPKKQSGR